VDEIPVDSVAIVERSCAWPVDPKAEDRVEESRAATGDNFEILSLVCAMIDAALDVLNVSVTIHENKRRGLDW
jgi:hypothetical protein